MLFVFLVTFIVFPGVMYASYFNFMSSWLNKASWYTTMINTTFNVFDTIGRSAGGSPRMNLSSKSTIIAVSLRILLIPFFFLSTFQVGPAWLFRADWFKILNLALFAFSNGYTSTLCAIKAPGTVAPERGGQVGSFIGTTISMGILAGSTIAVGVGKVIANAPAEPTTMIDAATQFLM